MDGRKIIRRSTQSISLPIDLIIEILLRLPAKSIAICRCVSKQWASLLRGPDFTEPFLTISSTRPRLLFTFELDGKWHFFSSSQPRNLDEQLSVVAADYHMGFSGYWYKEFCQPVRGFIYLIDRQMSKGKLDRVPVICNPSTGQHLALPSVRAKNNDLRSFFGYDPVEKQFKVLSMTVTTYRQQTSSKEHEVLTLGEGQPSWRKIECLSPHFPEKYSSEICIDGVLYYIGWTKTSKVIVCFDVRSEKFSFIEIDKGSKLTCNWNLVNYKGKLGALHYVYGSIFQLWVLDDTEKEMKSMHVFENSALHTRHSIWATYTGEIGWAPNHWTNPFYVFYYSPERQSVRRVEIKGVEEKLFMGRDHPRKNRLNFTVANYAENVMFLPKL